MINLIYTILPIVTMIIGFVFGFNIRKEDKLPEVKAPTEIIEEHRQKKKSKKEQDIKESYLENIENYPYNQKDIKE